MNKNNFFNCDLIVYTVIFSYNHNNSFLIIIYKFQICVLLFQLCTIKSLYLCHLDRLTEIKTYFLQTSFAQYCMINTLLGRASSKVVGFYCIKILSTNYSSYSSLSVPDSVSSLESLSGSLFSKSSATWFSVFIFSCAYLHSSKIV